MLHSTGVVVLSTYSREILLDQCLDSIYSADESEFVQKLITYQTGFLEVADVVTNYEDIRTSVIRVDGKNRSKLQNINLNYWNGFEVAFGVYNADWVLCVEEDAILSPDVFKFIDEIYGEFSRRAFFRGINLGSLENDPLLNGTYSLLRYGIHGSAGVITRRSWKILKLLGTKNKLVHFPFDSATEKYWRTGFMVTPNITKTLNFGWIDGTHTESDSSQPHFVRMQESWNQYSSTSKHTLENTHHSWGVQTRVFKLREQPRAYLKFLLGLFLDKRWYFRMRKQLSSIKRNMLKVWGPLYVSKP